MRLRYLTLGAVCFILIGCSQAESDTGSDLGANGCAIRCPIDAAERFAGLSAKVGCYGGYSPLCQ